MKPDFLQNPPVEFSPLKLSDELMRRMLEATLTEIYGEGAIEPQKPTLRVAS